MDMNLDNQSSKPRDSGSPSMEASVNVSFSSLPAFLQQQHSANQSGTSDRKRNRRTMDDDGALDDILCQITSKLTTLSTKENHTEDDSINAFVDVLNCARSEAQFYLESSNWNVETAAMLWLENNPTNVRSSSYLPGMGFMGNNGGGGTYADYQGTFPRPKSQPRYRARAVHIEGLPSEWTARVSKTTGYIYFAHIATGVTQYCVPTGFADLSGSGSPENTIDLSGTAASNNDPDDGNMADDSKDLSMEQEIEPLSPVSDPQGIHHMQNIMAQNQYQQSGAKSGNTSSGGFRSAMDEYFSDQSVSSSKAVWDEGSGYSLNDPNHTYSVSSTTTNSSTIDDNSSVFGNMAHARNVPSNGNHTNNTSSGHPASHNAPPHYTQNADGPMTQELAPTPDEEHQIHANSSGIAMLATPTDADNNADYFIGNFTPNSSGNSSSLSFSK